jgi:hypothetical protein
MLLSEEGFQHNRKPDYGQEAGRPSIIYLASAGVAELADAVALGATGRKSLEVQILSPAPKFGARQQRLRRSLHVWLVCITMMPNCS